MYRLRRQSDEPLSVYIQEKYFGPKRSFLDEGVSVGETPSLLVYGTMVTAAPKWLDHAEALTGFKPGLANETSAGVLLIPYKEYIYAPTWGMGFLILEPQFLDAGFGIRFAIRRADPRRVRSVTMNAIDVLPRTAKTSILGGAALSAFGVDEIGEVLNRLVVSVPSDGLSCAKADKKTRITVRGADALNLPLGRTPEALLRDIAFIDGTIESESVVSGLEHLEDTRQIRPGNPLIHELNEALEKSIGEASGGRIALSWPAEWDDERGEAIKFRFSGFGRTTNDTVTDIELDDLLLRIDDVVPGQRLLALKNGKVQALNHDGEPTSQAIAATKWLTYQVDLNNQRYVYSRGQWYNVGGAYIDLLHGHVERILRNRWHGSLPTWKSAWKERKKTGEPYRGRLSEAVSIFLPPPTAKLS
jgi:uncharacterized protein (TIGR04141 family)